jgi:uncharacterized protein
MERLIDISKRKVKDQKASFKRFLFNEIDWNLKLIMVLGPRGTGKTTLLLQQLSITKGDSIYLSLDDVYFEVNRLVELVESLYARGYRFFFMDEVHRYSFWSKDLKNLYDNFEDIRMVVTGSSILELAQGQADLSRRAVVYKLPGLSFREYVNLENELKIEPISLPNILKHHSDSANEISDTVEILKHFQKYLSFGYFPFYRESLLSYHSRLMEITKVIIEMDVAPFEEINHQTVRNMHKLLYIISQSVPFIPNISKLSEKLGASRNQILKILDLLEKAEVLNLLKQETKGVSFLQKPEKIYLNNPNLSFAMSNGLPDKGNLRETFFLSQTKVRHEVTFPKYGDFLVDDQYLFEIGGAGKTAQQIKGIPSAYIAADEIKSGQGSKIPLWLFGFLY